MINSKKEYKIDVPVLILFFNRPHLLKKVFDAVKEARPRKLYLYQDGPRPGRPDDIEKIKACRKIVSTIDWDCEIHCNYSEINRGCDPSEYLAQKWMFENEEMGIILEDDDVPSQSFFPFCVELLHKYKDDTRINMICGMNNTEVSDHCPYDYLFSTTGSITGWASWKRVIDMWEDQVNLLGSNYIIDRFCENFMTQHNASFSQAQTRLKTFEIQKQEGVSYYESILGTNAMMNSMLNIVPTKNLISNIGNDGESTHGSTSLKLLPRGIRRIFNMKTYEYQFPLKHPPYVVEDLLFKKKLYRIMANGHPWVSRYRRLESIFLRIRYGEFDSLKRGLKRRLHLKNKT